MGALALVEKLVVNEPHHMGLLRLDKQPSVVGIEAIGGVVAEHHPCLHAAQLAPFHPLGGFTGFLLGNAGHDGEAQLPIVVPGVDVVVDEDHPDAQAFQLPGVFQSVHRVSGEAGYLFGEDQVEPSQLSLGDHAVERLSLAGAGAGNALVGVYLSQSPPLTSLNVLGKINLLAV